MKQHTAEAPAKPKHRVVITGIGLHTAKGDLPQTWEALCGGGSFLDGCQLDKAEGFFSFAGARAAPEADPRPLLADRKLAKYMNPTTKMAVVAAGRALGAGRLLGDVHGCAELSLLITAGLIAFDPTEVGRGIEASTNEAGDLSMERLGANGLRRCHPLMPFKMLLNMPLGVTSIAFGIRGDNAINYPDSAQAGSNTLRAWGAIRSGRVPRVLLGAVSHSISLMPLCSLGRSGLLAADAQAALPFTHHHQGLAPADAAAFVLLEAEQSARARGIEPIAYLQNVWAGRRELSPDAPAGAEVSSDLGVICGSTNGDEDSLALRASGNTARCFSSLDGIIGHAFAAAPILNMALAAHALGADDARPLALRHQPAAAAGFEFLGHPCSASAFSARGITVQVIHGGQRVGSIQLAKQGDPP